MRKLYKVFYRNGFSHDKLLSDSQLEYMKKSGRVMMIQEIINNDGNISYKNTYIYMGVRSR